MPCAGTGQSPGPAPAPPTTVPRLLGALLAVAAFAYVLAFPLALNPADESLFLYGAKRIREGGALYRDVFWVSTPAAFYVFALVFAVAGTSLIAARVAMAAIVAGITVLLYVLARRFAGTLEAFLAALVFALVCYPVWNMASPHWLSTLLCLATATALFHERPGRAAPAAPAVAGVLAGLTFCTQQTQGLVLALWLGVTLIALVDAANPGQAMRRAVATVAAAATAWAAVVVGILGYSVWRSSPAEVAYALFSFVLDRYRSAFSGRIPWAGSTPLSDDLLAYTWPGLARAVPFILGAEMVAVLWTLAYRGGRAEVMRGCLFLLAAGMAASILYHPDFIHVAFIIPFPLIVLAGFVSAARTHRWAQWGVFPALGALALTAVFLAVLHKGWQTLALARNAAPERYPTAFGTIAGTADARRTLEGLREAVGAGASERRLFFSYPNNASFYLTVPGENPTPFSYLLKGFNTAQQFRAVFDALERTPAAYVVVDRFFRRPGDPFMEFLKRRYELRTSVGPGGTLGVYAPTATH